MWPILLRLGPITVYTFGLFLTMAFVGGLFFVWRQARRKGAIEESVLDAVFLAVFIALFAGRLGYVYSHWSIFATDFSRTIFFFKYPGFSFEWLVFSGLLALGGLGAFKGVGLLAILDFATPGLFFATAVAYIGCFFDRCLPNQANFVPVGLSLTAAFLWLLVAAGSKKVEKTPEVSDYARLPGFCFLAYLIFQWFSFLIVSYSNSVAVVFFAGLIAVTLAVFVWRYRQLFKFFYGAISQKRAFTGFHIPFKKKERN